MVKKTLLSVAFFSLLFLAGFQKDKTDYFEYRELDQEKNTHLQVQSTTKARPIADENILLNSFSLPYASAKNEACSTPEKIAKYYSVEAEHGKSSKLTLAANLFGPANINYNVTWQVLKTELYPDACQWSDMEVPRLYFWAKQIQPPNQNTNKLIEKVVLFKTASLKKYWSAVLFTIASKDEYWNAWSLPEKEEMAKKLGIWNPNMSGLDSQWRSAIKESAYSEHLKADKEEYLLSKEIKNEYGPKIEPDISKLMEKFKKESELAQYKKLHPDPVMPSMRAVSLTEMKAEIDKLKEIEWRLSMQGLHSVSKEILYSLAGMYISANQLSTSPSISYYSNGQMSFNWEKVQNELGPAGFGARDIQEMLKKLSKEIRQKEYYYSQSKKYEAERKAKER